MFWLFRSLTDRLKALFVADVASEFESQLAKREAERKAELLRRAKRYEKEGLNGIAQNLRLQAENLSISRPLQSVLPAIEHWKGTETKLLPYVPETPKQKHQSPPKITHVKKKGR